VEQSQPNWVEKFLPSFMRRGRRIDISKIPIRKLNEAAASGLEIKIDGDQRTADGIPTAEVNRIVIEGNTEG